MATKKKFKKMIKKLVNTMPLIGEHSSEEHFVTGKVLIEQGHTEHEGVLIDPEKTYKQRMPVIIARNHENRVKNIYKKYGRDGISKYVNEVKAIEKANAS